MSHRSLPTWFTRLLAAWYLALVAGPAVTLVFCAGTDGHRSIESALAEDCCTRVAVTTDTVQSRASHACDCVDTPLVLKATLQSATRGPASAPALHPVVFQPTAAAPTHVARLAFAGTALPEYPPRLAALRSIVLLI